MIAQLINILSALVVLGVVCWLVEYLINTIPGAAPLKTAARVILALIAILVLLTYLLPIAGINVL